MNSKTKKFLCSEETGTLPVHLTTLAEIQRINIDASCADDVGGHCERPYQSYLMQTPLIDGSTYCQECEWVIDLINHLDFLEIGEISSDKTSDIVSFKRVQ